MRPKSGTFRPTPAACGCENEAAARARRNESGGKRKQRNPLSRASMRSFSRRFSQAVGASREGCGSASATAVDGLRPSPATPQKRIWKERRVRKNENGEKRTRIPNLLRTVLQICTPGAPCASLPLPPHRAATTRPSPSPIQGRRISPPLLLVGSPGGQRLAAPSPRLRRALHRRAPTRYARPFSSLPTVQNEDPEP
jgi:hypothetical protein